MQLQYLERCTRERARCRARRSSREGSFFQGKEKEIKKKKKREQERNNILGERPRR